MILWERLEALLPELSSVVRYSPFLEETEPNHSDSDALRLVQAILTKACTTVKNCKCNDGCTLCKFYLYICHITYIT